MIRKSVIVAIATAALLAAPQGAFAQWSCLADSTEESIAATDSMVEARVVFITLPGVTDVIPAWADSLLVQLPRHIKTMSHGK